GAAPGPADPATPVAADPLAGLPGLLAPPPAPAAGALARRFRLAGTIHGGHAGGVAEPMAILDDRVEVRQLILTRGEEAAPGVVLAAVGDGTATLAGPDGEETLVLERRDPAAPAAARAPVPAASGAAAAAPKTRAEAAERFGGRETFPGRWTYDRGKVKAYYDELLSEPSASRALAVFDSMEPEYVTDLDGERRIDGYRLVVKGEPEFFLAAGLQEGDVVKSVNSMLMTNRRRAEDMIAAFATGAGSMFVLEIERGGKTFKQLYEFEDVPVSP
ncbi:MAG: hypothetical protein IJV65_00990, partial [Kiritimatiellae bacterium]|nr:hypothetical protein [Kiritimatiellia bacterium]